GYNLIHCAGLLPRGVGPGTLERARRALIHALAESLPPEKLPRTTIVFDARDAPPHRPRRESCSGMTVLFAVGMDDADALIEQLIARNSAPRRLTVVSSDHRIQKAARKRKATPWDSDVWFAQLLRERNRRRDDSTSPSSSKPEGDLSEEEIRHWLDVFETDDSSQEFPARDSDTDSPFPPGYAEDL
ncbi:MAG: NYN domain-containing protein, partial [Planctomycetales bacterium]